MAEMLVGIGSSASAHLSGLLPVIRRLRAPGNVRLGHSCPRRELGYFWCRMAVEQKLGASVWSIGSVAVRGRAVLAPMSGVTDIGFRRIAHRFGATLVVSEM